MTLGLFFLLLPCFSSALSLSRSPEEAVVQIDAAVQKKSKDKKLHQALEAALKNPETNIKVRERAAWALGQLEVRDAGPTLIAACKDRGLLVRSAALDALSHMRAVSAIGTFTQIAKEDPVHSLRQRAVIALGLTRSEKAIDTLVQLSSDEKDEIRGAATLAMAAIHSKKNDFSEIIKEMAGDPSPYVNTRATRALDIIRRKNIAVRTHFDSTDSDIRLFAALYFHYHGTESDLKVLKDAANVEADEEARYELGLAQKGIKRRAKAAAAKKASP